MKKRTMKQIAGALVVCMMMGAPANLCSVRAESPIRQGIFPMPEELGREDESTEEMESETTEGESDCGDSAESEPVSSEISTAEYDIMPESGTENKNDASEKENYKEQEDLIRFQEEDPYMEITNQGIFDYRTYIEGGKDLRICLKYGTEQKNAENNSDNESLTYMICWEDKNVIYFDENDEVSENLEPSRDITGISYVNSYITHNGNIPFYINGVGDTMLAAYIFDGKELIYDSAQRIEVQNSPLYDEDFLIELCPTEKTYGVGRLKKAEVRTFTYQEWCKYLEEHQGWINGTVCLKLSAQGEKYFSEMHMEEMEGAMTRPIYSSSGKNEVRQRYAIWAEHPDRNASTKTVEKGTREFVMGIDTEKPVVSGLMTESKCYEPTRTETEQYYAEDFILEGSFSDNISGVAKVEYTTDYTAGINAKWSEAAVTTDDMFSITLSDGSYEAIAVRVYDKAGNVSEPGEFVNDKGEPIKVIVDKSEPILQVAAKSGNAEYDGINDSWTNKDVVYHITRAETSCPYAGIYQCEYAYENIGDAVNRNNMTDVSTGWIGNDLSEKSDFRLEIEEDRNGYYYFRAVSKSGVSSKEAVKCRILTQHRAADIKPIVVNGVDDTKRKNGWYNKASGVPSICFSYPNYDTGVISGRYDAPVTIHYTLTAQTEEDSSSIIGDKEENNAVIGVMSSESVKVNNQGKKEFVLTKDDLDSHIITFGYDKKTGYAQDGIYTLEYWVTDKAGNRSEKQTSVYKIDSHEPTELRVEVAGNEMRADNESVIRYEHFYQEAVEGNASAQYGISGKGNIKILRAKKPGVWKDMDVSSFADGDCFGISPNTRCFLYVRAEDLAGNYTEGWTKGIVVDNMMPNQSSGKELFVEPEGANEHGFFNQDVKVRISVKDSPEDDNCAALMAVSSSVGKNGTDTITDKELFAFTKELPTDDELTQASAFETIQTINAMANESNEAYIEVTATDRAQNTKTSLQRLKIDVTKPVIDISFDREDGVNGRYYNQSRTATIHVQELNFDASAVKITVTRNGELIEMPLSDWSNDGIDHYVSVTFAEDGDYTMEVCCTDLADNASDIVQADDFTIDCTVPCVAVDLVPAEGGQMHNEGYYASGVTAQITVTEHNFNADDFVFEGTFGASHLTWKHKGDIHTAIMSFSDDNAYMIRCAYTDLAGNAADGAGLIKEFVIDTTAPMIAIAGVMDDSANSGDVTPVITVLDMNLTADAVSIAVTTGRGQTVENVIETAAIDDGSGVGYHFTLSDMTDKADDIYYLTVTSCDMAGNEASRTCRFSLNRNGSTYDFSDIVRLTENPYNTYLGMEDIVVTEMNVDPIDEFDMYISRNGALGYKAVYEKEVQGSDNIGYTYTYRIKRENFTDEGTYRLSMYSKDRAGNEVNNSIAVHGREVEFIIDNTAPKIVIDGVETGKVYDVEAQQVSVVVTDNFRLEEAELTLVSKNNDVLKSWDYMELSKEGEVLYITIPEYKEEVSLLYRLKDAAGNEIQTFKGENVALSDFLVTTDKLVQFVNKPTQTSFGRILITAFAIVAAGMIILLLHKRKNKGKIDR